MAGKALRCAVCAAVGLLHAAVLADNARRATGEGSPMPAEEIRKGSARMAPRDTLPSWLRNGDFETTDSAGAPADWNLFREGFFDDDPALARSGVRSVRSSFLYGWYQDMQVPVSPYQTFTLYGFAMREFADERAGARAPFFRADGSFVKDSFGFSPVDAAPGAYGAFWVPLEMPADAHAAQLFLRGESAQAWLRFDDLQLFGEQFSAEAGHLGEPWAAAGGASAEGSTVTLVAGSAASQRVAVGIENQAYFTWGRYETAVDAEVTLREDWLPRGAQETTATTSTVLRLAAPSGVFTTDSGRLAEKGSGLARITLSSEAAGPVSLSELRRGFAKVEPAILTAGPVSPDGSLKLTAAWPGHLTTASIEILSEALLTVDTPTSMSLQGTSVRAEWEPDAAAAGNYIARFTLESADGAQAVVDRSFQLVREDDATSSVPVYRVDEFVRGIWMFATSGTSPADTMATFQQARADGFNWTIVLANANKLSDVRQAAEATNMRFTVFVPEIISLFETYTQRSWFSKADYIGQLKQMFAPLVGSPLFQGVYLMDEPSMPEAFDVLRRVNLSVAQDGTLGAPFTVFFGSTVFENLEKAQPAVGLIDLYPYHLGAGGDPTRALLNAVQVENTRAKDFAALGRDMWLLPQAFINRTQENFYPVPQWMYTGQLGAAVIAGARGVLPFFYNSTPGPAQGMRGPGLVPTPMLEAFREFNAVAERLSPVLMQLDVPSLAEDVPYPFAVSTAAGPGGAVTTFVLNADDAVTRTLLIHFQQAPAAPPLDLVAERELPLEPGGAVRVELGPGQWAMFSAGSGSAIAGFELLPADPHNDSTIELPITHEFLVPRLDEQQGQPMLALDFGADATTLAASIGWFAFEPAAPMIFHLSTTDTVASREPGPLVHPAERYGATADNHFYAASPNLGMRMYRQGGFFDPPAASYMGHSGGTFDIISDGESIWISMFNYGIRQLIDTPQGLESAAVGRANFGPYTDIFGPFADGSITAIVNNFGVSNIKPDQLDESQHRQRPVFGADLNAAINSQRQLAVPRHQFGVGLLQLDVNGEVESVSEIAAEALDATAVAWVYDTVLAVADGYRSIRFYDVRGSDVTLIGTWRPSTLGENYMLSVAAKNGRLAVGTLNGQVIVADTRPLQPETAVSADWQLLE